MNWAWLEARRSWHVVRSRNVAFLVAGTALLVLLLALLEKRAGAAFALDRALLGSTFGFVVPLTCLALTRMFWPERLEEGLDQLSQYGVDRRWLLGGRALVMLSTQALVTTLLGWVTLLGTGPTHAWFQEAVALGWIGPLAGLAHGALQLLGLSLTRRGAVYALILDWLIGSSSSALGVPFPRSHLANLLGGEAVVNLVQPASGIALCFLIAVSLAVTTLRLER